MTMGDHHRAEVIVDPLLCFISNFRHEPNLEHIVAGHFSQSVKDRSQNLLLDILSDIATESSSRTGEPPSSLSRNLIEDHKKHSNLSLLALFDRLALFENTPIFAAADLTELPLVLIGKMGLPGLGDLSCIYDELRSIRYSIQNSKYSGASQTLNARYDFEIFYYDFSIYRSQSLMPILQKLILRF